MRGSVPGPLFQYLNGVPVIRTEFDEWLARVIKYIAGLIPQDVKVIVLG